MRIVRALDIVQIGLETAEIQRTPGSDPSRSILYHGCSVNQECVDPPADLRRTSPWTNSKLNFESRLVVEASEDRELQRVASYVAFQETLDHPHRPRNDRDDE